MIESNIMDHFDADTTCISKTSISLHVNLQLCVDEEYRNDEKATGDKMIAKKKVPDVMVEFEA